MNRPISQPHGGDRGALRRGRTGRAPAPPDLECERQRTDRPLPDRRGHAAAAGDLVAIDPPPAPAAFLRPARLYLPARPAAAEAASPGLPGRARLGPAPSSTVDGAGAARARALTRAHRPLPSGTGHRTVGRGELFLLNAAPDSLDGRYFRPLYPPPAW
ncbi:MAG: S26 family signal peptidase [Sphingomonadales bacterium]|nr:S26 family signal peptidase [Sphingomonadales bacterium]